MNAPKKRGGRSRAEKKTKQRNASQGQGPGRGQGQGQGQGRKFRPKPFHGKKTEPDNSPSKLVVQLEKDKTSTQELIPIDRSFQQVALKMIEEGKNLLISAPVGSGKTFLVYEVAKTRPVCLAVPTKALANNIYAAAKARSLPCKLTTGDFEIADPNYVLTIGTTEKISQLPEEELQRIVFVDEASWMFDADRGISTYMDMMRTHPNHQYILMSGTIDAEKTKTIFERVTGREIEIIDVKGSAIHHYYNIYVPRNYDEWKAIPKPCIIFCDNKLEAAKITQHLQKDGFTCALHHSSLDLLTKIKNEIHLQNGRIDFLIGTSGLAYGINTPTRSVVVYNSGLASVQTVAQILGRAGRPGFWSRGYAFGVSEKQLSRPERKKLLRLGLRDRFLSHDKFQMIRSLWVNLLEGYEQVEDICLNGVIDEQYWKFLENDVPVETQEQFFRDLKCGFVLAATDYLKGESYANDSTTLHWLKKMNDHPEMPKIHDLDKANLMFEERWKVQAAMNYLKNYHDQEYQKSEDN